MWKIHCDHLLIVEALHEKNKAEMLGWMCVHLLAGEGRRHNPDLCHPLLLGGAVDGLDQQWYCLLWRVLHGPGSVDYSISLYPEVRRVTAFQSHWTSLSAVKKPHCRRHKHRHLLKRGWKKTVLGNTDVENRKMQDAGHKGCWFSFMLMHYSLQAVPQKAFLKAVEKEMEGGEKTKAFPFSAI